MLFDVTLHRRQVLPFVLAFLGLLGLLLAGGRPLYAQNNPEPDNSGDQLQQQFTAADLPTASADVVDVETRLATDSVPAGEMAQAAVLLKVDDGWHVNAHEPTLDYLIGTTLDWASQPDVMVNQVQYPEPKRLQFDFEDEALDVYEERVPIFLTLRPAASAEPGAYRLTGELRVQACNDRACLRPSTLTVTLSVPVTHADAELEAGDDPLFEEFSPGQAAGDGTGDLLQGGLQLPTSVSEVTTLFRGGGFFLGFGIVFLVGLALNLTPCVYPMLSVTVSLFGSQKETRPARAFGRASLYVGGIVTMYSVLGVLAAYTGQLFGGWLQSVWVTGGIGVLLLLLAASMLGAFPLQLPASVQTRLGGAQQATGPLGTYLAGLLVGVVAAPCIGPPVIAVLAFVGQEGDPILGLTTMAVMALGLGAPYLVLGTFSGLLARLPQSGRWMVWVKKGFGVILLGVGLFYLGLAVAPDWAYYAVPAMLLIGGLYLAVLALRPLLNAAPAGGRSWLTQGLLGGAGVLALVGALWAVQELQADGVTWTPYSEDVLAEAQAQNQPVVLDFTADWCIPCQELDQITFTDGDVVAAMQDVRSVKVDLTEAGTTEAEALRDRYDVAGVPTIVFLDSNGNEVEAARAVGFIGPEEFLSRLQEARESPAASGSGDGPAEDLVSGDREGG